MTELARGFRVSEDFFRVVGVAPALGRPFTAEKMNDPAVNLWEE